MSGHVKIEDRVNTDSGNVAKVTNNNLHIGLYKEDQLPIIVDDVTSAISILEYGHHEIHDGNHYLIDNFLDLANNQVYDIILNVPDVAKRVHLVYEYYYEREGSFELWEGVTTDADGTLIPNYNNDRDSSSTAGLIITHTPTNPSTGSASLLINQWIGSGRGIGGTRRADQEKILKRNTKYLIRATNRALGSENLFNYQLDWYEHTPKV
jgi:hypothetical protein